MIDKLLIEDELRSVDYCPHCQEKEIEEVLNQIVLDDDIEEAMEIATDQLKLCKNCYADEMSDLKRM